MIIENLNFLAFILTIITISATISIFLIKISTVQKNLAVLCDKILCNQERAKVKSDLFYQKFNNDTQMFKEDVVRHNNASSNHHALLGNVLSNQKAQEITQSHMKSLFEEIKKLTINTNKAINDNSKVLAELLFHLKKGDNVNHN
jgi:endonuclease III